MPVNAYAVALALTLAHEGGFVNNPLDHGKATNFGISMATLSAWRTSHGKPEATVDDVKALTVAEVSDIYKALYWDKIGGDQLASGGVAAALFDTAVLNGVGTAAKAAQTIANLLGNSPPLTVDGCLGARSIAAINACDPRKFVLQLIDLLLARYVSIVTADATQMAFLSGWSKRAASLTAQAVA